MNISKAIKTTVDKINSDRSSGNSLNNEAEPRVIGRFSGISNPVQLTRPSINGFYSGVDEISRAVDGRKRFLEENPQYDTDIFQDNFQGYTGMWTGYNPSLTAAMTDPTTNTDESHLVKQMDNPTQATLTFPYQVYPRAANNPYGDTLVLSSAKPSFVNLNANKTSTVHTANPMSTNELIKNIRSKYGA